MGRNLVWKFFAVCFKLINPFLVQKTPLSMALRSSLKHKLSVKRKLVQSFFANNRNISENSRFTPSTLIVSLRDRGLNLGLVVDLTNTTRYYDPEEFTSNGVQYEKIFVEGRTIPKKEVIDKFYKVLDIFYQNSEEGSLVGVHCTHGVNKTGYVVCRYMVENLGMTATEALKAYRIARGYPVDRMTYINDLRRIAGEHVDWRRGQQSYQGNRRFRHHYNHWENNPGANGYDPHRGGGHSRGFHSNNSGSDSRPTRGAARGNRR